MSTAVSRFIDPKYRGQKLGVPLFEAAVRRCLERGFEKIHIDVMSTAMKKTLERMDQHLRKHLNEVHHDIGGFYVMDLTH